MLEARSRRACSSAAQLEVARTQIEEDAPSWALHDHPRYPEAPGTRRRTPARLKRKYGAARAVVEHLARSKASSSAERLGGNERDDAEALRTRFAAAARCARALSGERKRAAGKLAAAISKELASLGMGGARIEVAVSPLEGRSGEIDVDGARLSAAGLDRAEFLIAPNKGETARPLTRIASGGELSRAMLAVNRVLADIGPAGMYVFDEVDSGVGGGIAEVIGRKIKDVADHRQVLCITHLPQIAVFADHHYKVEKQVIGERTQSNVRKLSRKQQDEEIARMLGGLRITAKTRRPR